MELTISENWKARTHHMAQLDKAEPGARAGFRARERESPPEADESQLMHSRSSKRSFAVIWQYLQRVESSNLI